MPPMTTVMTIPGKATARNTATYHTQHQLSSHTLYEWQVSAAGFGGYRIQTGVKAHAAALATALRRGINLIDTSTNYGDGRSEQLVGEVVGELINAAEVRREEIVIVSKAGYLQGENYARSQERKAAGAPWPDLVTVTEGVEHCIHPDFLADQLTRSLERLNLETLDVLLLHNPEYYLAHAAQQGVPLDEARDAYYRRIALAFEHLEQEAADGRIQCYGISSNTFVSAADDPEFTSLTRCWQAAGAETHFRVIQLPFNLLEASAVLEKNQPRPGQPSNERAVSVLEVAQALNLGVLTNRPLNAIHNNELTRLADVPRPEHVPSGAEVSTAVDRSVQAETTFRNEILPLLDANAETKEQLLEYLGVGLMLQGRWPAFGNYQTWQRIGTQFVVPRVTTALQFLLEPRNLPPEAHKWVEEYERAVNATLAAVGAFYQAQGAAAAQVLHSTAVLADADWWTPSLSQTAVRAVRSTAGVTSVLVGMRQVAYVEDVVAELQRPVAQKPREASWRQVTREMEDAVTNL